MLKHTSLLCNIVFWVLLAIQLVTLMFIMTLVGGIGVLSSPKIGESHRAVADRLFGIALVSLLQEDERDRTSWHATGSNEDARFGFTGLGPPDAATVELLDRTRVPCSAVMQGRDPCELRHHFGFEGGVPASRSMPASPPSYQEILFNSYGVYALDDVPPDLLMAATHLVARGSFIPGTTRCGSSPLLFPAWAFGGGNSPYADIPEDATVQGEWNLQDWTCHTVFRVDEYLAGTGPSEIPVSHPSFGFSYDITQSQPSEESSDELDAYKDALADSYEGYEWVVWLGAPPITTVVSWAAYAYWDVQKDPSGTIRVVSPDFEYFEAAGVSGSELRKLNAPLDEFRRDVAAAHQARVTRTGGRVGVPTSTPKLVTDAKMLESHFEEIGASSNPIATPMSAPIQPMSPGALTAGAPTGSGIPLSWSEPDYGNVTGYKVVRRVPKGEFVTVVADTGSTETAYTDASAPMTAGVTYIYRVVALNEYGESLASNRATVELPGPDAPADFTATNYEGDVVLTWTQPGVIMPSCYRIYRRAQGEQSFEWVVNCWSAELRSWRDDDVVSGTRYIYRIVPMIGYTESGATARASIRVR